VGSVTSSGLSTVWLGCRARGIAPIIGLVAKRQADRPPATVTKPESATDVPAASPLITAPLAAASPVDLIDKAFALARIVVGSDTASDWWTGCRVGDQAVSLRHPGNADVKQR
jgi:hypothetical protein